MYVWLKRQVDLLTELTKDLDFTIKPGRILAKNSAIGMFCDRTG